MKTFEQALAWVEDVKAFTKSAPEGMYASSSDVHPTLRDVDPEAITGLYKWFSTLTPVGPSIMRWQCKLEGSEDGAFYSLTIIRGAGPKRHGDSYRFFYRSTSNRTRREAYAYAL